MTVPSDDPNHPAFKFRIVGAIGDATCFSFYAIKNITTGEGGMVAVGDSALQARLGQEVRLTKQTIVGGAIEREKILHLLSIVGQTGQNTLVAVARWNQAVRVVLANGSGLRSQRPPRRASSCRSQAPL